MIGLGLSAPWVLAAAAALAVPIIAHLARHEDRAGQGFPSLMFLRRVPFPARARHRLEDRVLLALRALALLALVLAFAGPYLRDADGAAVPPGDTVVLLDLSYSMRLGDRFARAREAAGAAIAESGADARVALIGFDSAPRTLSALEDGRAAAQAALARAAPGVHGTDLAAALQGAWRLLAASAAAQRRVVLVSDLQAAGVGADPRLPEGVELALRAVGGTPPANLAILAAWREAAARDRDGRTPLRVRVANTGGEAAAGTLQLAVDGLQAAPQALELAAGERRDLTLPLFPAADRATRVELRLDPPDALALDDARYLVLAPPRPLHVLLVREAARADAYLTAALALARDPIMRSEALDAGQLTVQQLQRADVIVLDGTPALDASLRRALDARVAAGAGLLAFAGDGAAASAAADSLAALPVPGARVDAAAAGIRLGPLARNHPLARKLDSARLEGVRVWRYRALQAGANDAVLARHDDGTPALLERVHGEGRSLQFATSPARGWSDLAVDPVFVPLLLESLIHLSGRVAAVPEHAPGSVLEVAAQIAASGRDGPLARAVAAGQTLWLRTPSGAMQRVRGDTPLRLDEPGFHELRADGGAQWPLAVSVLSAESTLDALDAEDFAARVRRYPHAQAAFVPGSAAADGDGALARALLLLGLGLLFVEGAFAARATRRRAAPQVHA